MKRTFLFVTLAFAAFSPAQTLFSTLGPGDSYIENIGRAVSGESNSITQSYGSWGWQFTSLASGSVAQIKVGAHWLTGTNSALVTIHANGSGDTMGATMASYTITGMPAFNAPEHVTTISIASPTANLVAGSKYWISMAPTHADTYAAWMDSDRGMFGRMSVSTDGINYGYVDNMPYSAFSLSSVPEPATMAAMGLGCLAMARRRRRNFSA